MRRSRRLWLWARYALRRHPLTGKRVKGLRWQLDAGPGSRPAWRLYGKPEPNGVWAGWEWPA